MGIANARAHLQEWGLDGRILEMEASSATVELAAQAVGCEPARIAKTLAFKVGEKAVLVVTAGDARIDNPKYKAYFQTKAKMLTPEETASMVGHAVGGVCPFGIHDGVMVYLDDSLKRFDSVFPACGSGNSAIELSLEEMERCSGYTSWVDVTRGWT